MRQSHYRNKYEYPRLPLSRKRRMNTPMIKHDIKGGIKKVKIAP